MNKGRATALKALCAAFFVPGAVFAETWVDNPGLCEADDGIQELADMAYLTPEGIESHHMRCMWTQGPQSYDPGRVATLSASCEDGATTQEMTFEMSVSLRGRVTLFSDGPAGLPEFYFPCSLWGWKGD